MKRLFLAIAVAFITTAAFAQKSKTVSAYNYFKHQEFTEAQKAIDESIEHVQTKEDAKTWYYRGLIYHSIYSTGMDTVNGNPELLQQYPDALVKAAESFEKAAEYDRRGSYTDQIKQYNAFLTRDFFNAAAIRYAQKDYEGAASYFEKYMEILDKAQPGAVDTNAVLYTAQSYYMSQNNQKAKQYLNQLQELKFGNPWIYQAMYELQIGEQDTAAAMATLEKGRQAFPDDKNLAVYEVNIYLTQGKYDELTEKLEETKKLDPENVSIYTTLGTVYQQLGKNDEARENFQQALELDEENFEANFGLGKYFYDQGVSYRNESLEEDDKSKQANLETQFKESFNKALPYFEKAHALNAQDRETMQAMLTIHLLLGNEAKADELNEKLSGS